MPTVQGTDTYDHNDFAVPGGASYTSIFGMPTRDLTIVRAGDPASLLISTSAAAEAVEQAISGAPAFAWCGFWWRIESGGEPASDVTVATFDVASGARAKLSYQPSQDRFYHFWDGGTPVAGASSSYTPGSWVWIEMIASPASTREVWTRFGGVDISVASLASSATSITHRTLGPDSGTPTVTMRYSRGMWGTASSSSDWLGEPVIGQILLPDADLAEGGWTTAPLFSKINDSSDASIITATAS